MAELGEFLVPTLINDREHHEALEGGAVSASALRQGQRPADEGLLVPTPGQRIEVARRHGVRVIAGTDAGSNTLVGHGDNAEELGMLVRARASRPSRRSRQPPATGHAATAAGLPDRGRVLSGYRADLMVLSADPTTDVAF